jgi:hypothetical protein
VTLTRYLALWNCTLDGVPCLPAQLLKEAAMVHSAEWSNVTAIRCRRKARLGATHPPLGRYRQISVKGPE